MRFPIISIVSAALLLVLFSCESKEKTEEKPAVIEKKTEPEKPQPITIPDDATTTQSGLKYIVIKEGDGKSPEKGRQVAVHYTGYLMSGKKFDSSYDRNEPLEFTAGMRQMIPGFDEGVMTMKEGGKRKLFIPSDQAYGSKGIPGVIPPDAMIVFEVELLEVK